MNPKHVVLSAILAFSILGPVTAYAASSQSSSATSSNSAAASPSAGPGQAGPMGGSAHHNHPGHSHGPNLQVVASVIGVDVKTLKTDLAAGKTLVQIAATKGMSESTLISKLHDAEKTRLDALVSSGKMTSAEEQKRIANFDAHAKQFVESKHTGVAYGRPHWGVMRGGLIRDSAAALNMTPEDLVTELRSGKSIVDVAKTKGVTEAQLTATLTSKVQAKLNANVANGKMPQGLADKAIAGFKSHISTVLNRKGGPWLRADGPNGHGAGHAGAGTGTGAGTSAGSGATGSQSSTSGTGTSGSSGA